MNSERNLLASIVIPTFNRAEYLQQALSSIKAQDYRPIQVVVIDDGSTDRTPEVIQSFADSDLEIIYRRTPASGGPSTPRNIGMYLADGECIFLFDSDDIMLPGKLRETIAAYKIGRKHDIGLYFTNFVKIDARGTADSQPVLSGYDQFLAARKTLRGSRLYEIDPKTAYTTLCTENFIGTSSVMIPRSTLHRYQLRFDTALRNSEDRELWFRIAQELPIGYVDIPGHGYRIHEAAITTTDSIDTIHNRIRVLERQLSQQLNAEQRKHLRNRVRANRMSEGYWHERNDQFKTARLIYREIFLSSGDLWALRRIFVTLFKQILPKERTFREGCEVKRTQQP